MNLSNLFPQPCKLRLFREQQVKHDCNRSLAPRPAGREQHPPLQFIPLTLQMFFCPLGTALCTLNPKALPRQFLGQDYLNLDQAYGRGGASKCKHLSLTFQHWEMHPRAVWFIAIHVVSFSPHACSTGSWVGAVTLRGLEVQTSLPISEEPWGGSITEEVQADCQDCFVHCMVHAGSPITLSLC